MTPGLLSSFRMHQLPQVEVWSGLEGTFHIEMRTRALGRLKSKISTTSGKASGSAGVCAWSCARHVRVSVLGATEELSVSDNPVAFSF